MANMVKYSEGVETHRCGHGTSSCRQTVTAFVRGTVHHRCRMNQSQYHNNSINQQLYQIKQQQDKAWRHTWVTCIGAITRVRARCVNTYTTIMTKRHGVIQRQITLVYVSLATFTCPTYTAHHTNQATHNCDTNTTIPFYASCTQACHCKVEHFLRH